jgi:hypothetical protein
MMRPTKMIEKEAKATESLVPLVSDPRTSEK